MKRLISRHHFMSANLLESQLATLELGDDVKALEKSAHAEEVAAELADDF